MEVQSPRREDPLGAAEIPVTDFERARYRDVGFIVRERVFSERELRPLRDAVEAIHGRFVDAASRPGAAPVEHIDDKRYQSLQGSTVKWEWREGAAEIRSMEPCHHLDSRLGALLDEPKLWLPAASLLGTASVSLFSDKLNFKRPGGAPFPWHQDTPYWAFDCDHVDQLVSVLLYLDDATRENGCLWAIPGSHQNGTTPCLETRGVLGRLYTDPDRVVGGEPVAIEAPAGSAMYFSGDLVHGSQSNRSRGSRRALVITYQPANLPRWKFDDIRPVENRKR